MEIQKIHIENFGKLHDFDMDFQKGINIIRASNGWGKSTLAAFLKAMFYGLEYSTKRSLKDNERKRYAPWQGGVFGGNMVFKAKGKSYRAERFFGIKNKEDTFALYDLDTGLLSSDYSERLGEELFHLDRTAFERSSFFAQQDFSASLNDSLNARLTHVEEDAGDMQNYEKAVSSLEGRMKYFRKTGQRGHIAQLEEERRKIQSDLAECRRQEESVTALQQEIVSAVQQQEALRNVIAQKEILLRKAQDYETLAERKSRYEELIRQTKDREQQLRAVGEQLKQFGDAPPGEEQLDSCQEKIYRLREIQRKEEEHRKAEEKIRRELEELDREGKYLPKRYGKVFVFLTAAAAAAAVMAAVVFKFYIPGLLAAAAGCGLTWYLARREGAAAEQDASWKKRWEQKDAELQRCLGESEKLHRNGNALKAQICRELSISGAVRDSEFESCWKNARERSRTYAKLQRDYAGSAREFERSRELFREYAERFSEEEIQGFQNLQKPDAEASVILEKLEQSRNMQSKVLEEKTILQGRLERLKEKAEQIPELEEEEERLNREIEEETREHGLLEKTAEYLKKAREQFSIRYLKELQQGMEKYLEVFSEGEIKAPSLDVKLKVKMQEGGASRDLEAFSAGWQDMVQIAERFAIIDVLYEKEQPILILDDPFVNLDTEKQKRAMKLLGQLGERWQMIYFTCHE